MEVITYLGRVTKTQDFCLTNERDWIKKKYAFAKNGHVLIKFFFTNNWYTGAKFHLNKKLVQFTAPCLIKEIWHDIWGKKNFLSTPLKENWREAIRGQKISISIQLAVFLAMRHYIQQIFNWKQYPPIQEAFLHNLQLVYFIMPVICISKNFHI